MWTTAKGIETWFAHKSIIGIYLATVFKRHLVNNTGMENRGTKSKIKKQFYVLIRTNMPAILTENGFYNNPSEVLTLMTDSYLQKVIDAHVAAIMEIEKNGI